MTKRKLYYLTRSYSPYQKGGGPLMRNGAVKYLQHLGWDIVVIMPNYNSHILNVEKNIIQIPQTYNIKLALYLERIGLYEDYLDSWIKVAFKYLADKITKDDIIFATSGGELGMIKLGALLKNKIGCKLVVNFRDPLDYSLVNGLKLNNKFHVSREQKEKTYLNNTDLIITSSKINQYSLQNKYPILKEKIINNYFGYIEKINLTQTKKENINKLKIAYVGNMGNLQKPEILYEIYKKINHSNIEIYFIGNININKKLLEIKKTNDKNIKFIDFLPHNDFLNFMSKKIDIGFVSLTNDYLGACVPSKIYEYINLELPILGALPNGDGKDIINNYNYGIACKYDDIDGLSDAIVKFTDKIYLENIKLNIQKDKDKWFMKNRILEVDKILKELING